MANAQTISKMVSENFGNGLKKSFIEKNFCEFGKFVSIFSKDAAAQKMDSISAYEEVHAICAYFSQEAFNAQNAQ